MTQFEFDQLTILAGSFEIEATNAPEAEARMARRHAHELRELLRYVDTIRPPLVVTTPAPPNGNP